MTDTNYDFVVAYRIYPKISKVPPVYAEDKFKLSELCLDSFVRSIDKLRVMVYAILDNCPPEYEELFMKYFPDEDLVIIKLDGIGNPGTFGKQVEVLLNQNYSEYIYFAEDDYFYLPNTFNEMLNLIKSNNNIDFITPFDHPDYYNLKIQKIKTKTLISGNRHWQKVATTCMTFLTTQKTLTKTKKIFMSYTKRNYDSSLWYSLTKFKIFNLITFLQNKTFIKIFIKTWFFGWKQILFGKKRKLYSPIPSISTHMDNVHMAPNINWSELFNQHI